MGQRSPSTRADHTFRGAVNAIFTLAVCNSLLNLSSPSLPPPHQQQNPNERKPTPEDRIHHKQPLKANVLPQMHGIERKRHPNHLPHEVEDLCHLARVISVAVNRVRIACRRDYLQPKTAQTDGEDRHEPMHTFMEV